jgi:hypothetical protein
VASLLLPASPIKANQAFTINVDTVAISPKSIIKYTENQLQAWKEAPEAQFEGPELRALDDDWKLYQDAVKDGDEQMQKVMSEQLYIDWTIIQAVDESLKGIDII